MWKQICTWVLCPFCEGRRRSKYVCMFRSLWLAGRKLKHESQKISYANAKQGRKNTRGCGETPLDIDAGNRSVCTIKCVTEKVTGSTIVCCLREMPTAQQQCLMT